MFPITSVKTWVIKAAADSRDLGSKSTKVRTIKIYSWWRVKENHNS